MARINEFKADGGAFADAAEAISTLENFLEEVQKTGDESTSKLDRERLYRGNISGLKDCFSGVIGGVTSQWEELGLDTSFVQIAEDMQQERFAEQVMFRHPVYEHVWLTDPDGNDVGDDLLPFFTYNLEYIKQDGLVTVSVTQLETRLNLPDLKTALKTAREDIEMVKKEAELVANVSKTAQEVLGRFTGALEKFCSKNELKLEAADSASPSADDVDALETQEFDDDDQEEPEIVDVDEIDSADLKSI